jgi:hypothetical protein
MNNNSTLTVEKWLRRLHRGHLMARWRFWPEKSWASNWWHPSQCNGARVLWSSATVRPQQHSPTAVPADHPRGVVGLNAP